MNDMIIRRNRGARAALLALEADAASTRGGFACMFSTSDEYESAVISERRARGRYDRWPAAWPFALFAGCAALMTVTILLWH
jgi:hypothetical protein